VLEAALSYAANGVYVFPLKPGSKAPITAHGVHDATVDAEQIRKWWSATPDAGIGIACGPSGLLVVDVDKSSGLTNSIGLWTHPIEELELTNTYTIQTPSGGWHFYYQLPDDVTGNTVSKLHEGVDTRGVGGYVVAPPTTGYAVVVDSDVVPLPEQVKESLAKPSQVDTERLDRASILAGVSEGGRDDALFKYACSLRARGVDEAEAEILVGYAASQCDPPFPADEASAKVERAYSTYDPPDLPVYDSEWVEFTFEQLCTSTLPPITWVVADLVPEGTTLLAGPPKLGKSWFVLDLAISVSTGRPFLGQPTIAGDVLVLALEDNARRLQGRTRSILGSTPVPPADALKFRTMAPHLGAGLEETINRWAGSVPSPRLVVIDTLGRVQGGRKDGDPYGVSVSELASLQALSTAHGMAIVCVTHTRKVSDTQGADFLESVLGSQGLAGTADSILVLRRKRGEDDGTLFVTGREIKNETPLQIRFDAGQCRWQPRTGD
jgi:hypothetical protein